MPVENYSTAEILLTGRQRLEKPLLWMIWLGTVSFSFVVENMLYVAASTLAVGVNMLAARENKEIYVRRTLVNIGVLLATGMAIFELWGSSNVPLVTVGHYMVLIQLCKLFERKRTRDYVQLLALNMLLMVTASLQSTSPWFAFVALAYMILACYVMMVFTLKRGLDEAAGKHLRSEAGPLAPQRIAWNVVRGWPGRALRRLLLLVMLPSLFIGLAAFLLMPRAADIMLPFGMDFLDGQFSNKVQLGGDKQLYLSDRVVMWVKVTEDGEVGRARQENSRYLRRRSLNIYKNSTWQNDLPRYTAPGEVWLPMPSEWKKPAVRHDVEINAEHASDLPAPYPTLELAWYGQGEVRMSAPFNYQLVGRSDGKTMQYTAFSWPHPLTQEQLSYLAETRAQAGLSAIQTQEMHLPQEAAQRIRKLAVEWAGNLLEQREANPEQRGELNLKIAQRLAMKLQGYCEYSLELDSNPDRDGVEDFLFYMRAGHCEYFASSLAVMCRLLDVPARVAVGFMLSEYEPDDRRYIVRERDAHAWCEVYSPETDWVVVDATPGSDRLASMGTSWWQKLRDFFQDLRFSWNRNVVGYEDSHRQEIRGSALDWLHVQWDRFVAWLGSLKESFMRLLREGAVDLLLLDFLVLLVILAVIIFVLILLGPLLKKYRKHRREMAKIAGPRFLPPIQQLMHVLVRRGFTREPGQTLREYLPAAAQYFTLDAAGGDAMLKLAELQYRWRWGGREPDAAELQSAHDAVQRIVETISSKPKE